MKATVIPTAFHQAPVMRLTTESIARVPWATAATIAALAAIGLAAIARSQELLDVDARFLQRQLLWLAPSLALGVATARMNYRWLFQWSYLLYAALIGLLIAVFWFPAINGAHRWFRLFGLGVQPSEFAKLALILALARYLKDCERHRQFRGLAAPFLLTVAPLLLILREPDLGTSLVFLPILFAMLIAASARLRDLAVAGTIGLALCPVLWQQMSREQRSRVTALFEQSGPRDRPTDDGYHLHQSKQVFALGGVWGGIVTGEVTDDREVYHLPVAHSDFIFAVIGERFGLWGTALVLLAFLFLIQRLLAIGRGSRDPFGRLISVGVAALFAVEVLVNTAMTVGLAPVTGLSLPLVSYGGSGLLAHSLALGLALSVAIHPGYEIAAS